MANTRARVRMDFLRLAPERPLDLMRLAPGSTPKGLQREREGGRAAKPPEKVRSSIMPQHVFA
jgi:hypothetical protein